MANLMNNEPGSKPEEAAKKSAQFTEEMLKVRDSMAFLKESHPELWSYLDGLVRVPRTKAARRRHRGARGTSGAVHLPPVPPAAAARGRRPGASDLPFTQSVFDAGIWIDGTDPDLTMLDIRPGMARDMNILPHGNVATSRRAGAAAIPVGAVEGRHHFQAGFGPPGTGGRHLHRAGPLAARVIVNRVWGWHFGKPLVATASDFGSAGRKADASGIAGRSGRALHRQRLVAQVAASRNHAVRRVSAGEPAAPGRPRRRPANALLWRMNPRRLDIEAYRDNLLQVSGDLEDKAPGLSLGSRRRRQSHAAPSTAASAADG